MKMYYWENQSHGMFEISVYDARLQGMGALNGGNATISTIVYNPGAEQTVTIDHIPYTMPECCVLPLVANQYFKFEQPENLIAWQFNREFYCIADHDVEVGCVGFLFYGIQHPLFVHLSPEEQKSIAVIENLCREDMEIKDRMQGEMLRTLLKRLIIRITRIAKKQTEYYQQFSDEKMDAVRMFNLLVETYFRKEHEVRFYARALKKSPKTLTNLFGTLRHPSPSRLIQRRIILEAKRYLHYTDKSAKEIAYALGFSSPAHFSRFFKLHSGSNISMFREMER
jgi:AraC family transcriptional activator of pobA